MIRLDDVWKLYDGRPALRAATLHVAQGEAVVLCGPSGAGKTTLLRLLYLAELPERGTVQVAGRDLSRLRRSSIPYVRRNVGVVFQDCKLLTGRSVRDNVAIAAEVLGLPRREVKARAAAALQAVGLLGEASRPVQTLSGGMQQRVALARALCADPPILLCDEPTGNLDPTCAREVLALLEDVRSRGGTLLIATHDPTVVSFGMAHGWRKAELVGGEIVAGGLAPGERLAREEAEVGLTVGPAGEAETARLTSGRPLRPVTAERSLELNIEVDLGESVGIEGRL